MTIRSIGSGLALSALALICLGQPGFAADPDYCGQYANKAVRAQLTNIQHQCGFTGRRWSTNYQDHFGWCVRARWISTDSEEQARRRMLRFCRGLP